ncbi:MAG: serine/threonine protein kinase [Gemmataceae bacterium]|nr:serine/threonine protein kinase [Gemmataceae bacterium]
MASSSVDRDAFVAHLRQSGLIAERDLSAVIERLQEAPRARVGARLLVELGLLTKFQAELILIGRSQGFFLGPYKILEQLGQGGMGRVYKALHQPMNRLVALKVLAPSVTKTRRAQKLFAREVQAAAQLHHPNIVIAYDAGQLNGRHYFAMEYVDGPNLDELVRGQGRLPAGTACELTRQAAAGLQHAFEMGMLHRDIKPANLLVQPAKKKAALVKILDFGLARLQAPSAVAPGSTTIVARANVVMGTPDFIAPEQARNLHKADIRSDLYSLGGTMYWLLTARVPFPGGGALEKLLRHNTDMPQPIDGFRADVPEAVAAIVTKLLAKDPAERFQSPQELIDALNPFAQPAALAWNRSQRAAVPSTPAPVDEPPAHGAETMSPAVGITPVTAVAAQTLQPLPPARGSRPTRAGAGGSGPGRRGC